MEKLLGVCVYLVKRNDRLDRRRLPAAHYFKGREQRGGSRPWANVSELRGTLARRDAPVLPYAYAAAAAFSAPPPEDLGRCSPPTPLSSNSARRKSKQNDTGRTSIRICGSAASQADWFPTLPRLKVSQRISRLIPTAKSSMCGAKNRTLRSQAPLPTPTSFNGKSV